LFFFFFSSRRRHTRFSRDWSSDVCSSDLFQFRSSIQLAAAYGLAVTGTMTITGLMITAIFFLRSQYLHGILGIGVTVVDVAFLEIGRAACRERVLRYGGESDVVSNRGEMI